MDGQTEHSKRHIVFFAKAQVVFRLSWLFLLYLACPSLFPLAGHALSSLRYEFWLEHGYSVKEANQIYLEQKKGDLAFKAYLETLPDVRKKRIYAILKGKDITSPVLFPQIASKSSNTQGEKTSDRNKAFLSKPEEKIENLREQRLDEIIGISNGSPFVGGSYQTNDRSESRSSIYSGWQWNKQKVILEKRQEEMGGSLSLEWKSFSLQAGNRYKPIPHFYFAKDPDFYSAFDGFPTLLPQPILPAFFGGYSFGGMKKIANIGLYHASSVTERPGIYLTQAEGRYSATYEPTSGIGSLFVNETLSKGIWVSRLQGEGIGNQRKFLGFLYGKAVNSDLSLALDGTAYRDALGFLSSSLLETMERNSVIQALEYGRIRFKDYFVLEGLQARDGLQSNFGFGGSLPFYFGDYGALVGRIRKYQRSGAQVTEDWGRGLFYEFRKNKVIFSGGFEKMEASYQYELKFSYPIAKEGFLEISGMMRDPRRTAVSWFENWTLATDFNMTLTERAEIVKLKVAYREFSANISATKQKETEQQFFYANVQFLLVF